MKEIKYIPIGQVHLTSRQKKDNVIKRLRFWVAALAVADILYTVLMGFIIFWRW